jgi:TPR repeat protein
LAQYNLGYLYRNGHGVTQDYAKARHFYELAAEQGHASGQFGLGYLYDEGLGVLQDFYQRLDIFTSLQPSKVMLRLKTILANSIAMVLA